MIYRITLVSIHLGFNHTRHNVSVSFLHRYDKSLLTLAGKIKKRCFLCREAHTSKAKVTVRDSIEELLKPPPQSALVSPRAPPASPRLHGENPDCYNDPSPVPSVADFEEDEFEADAYAADEFLILNSLGVRSVSEITEDLINKAKPNCQIVLRETLRIAQNKNPSIQCFADMPNSEVKWSTPAKDMRGKDLKSPKSINKARSVTSYADSGDYDFVLNECQFLLLIIMTLFSFVRGVRVKFRDNQAPCQEEGQRSLVTCDHPPRRQHPFSRSGFSRCQSDRRRSWFLRSYLVLLSL